MTIQILRNLALLPLIASLIACGQQTSEVPTSNSGTEVQFKAQAVDSGLSLPIANGATWYMTSGPHNGANLSAIDLSNTSGGGADGQTIDVAVLAAADGVVQPLWNDNCGFRIDHNNIATYYYHVEQEVGFGSTVTRGQRIARLKMCGLTTGWHVHFGVLQKGTINQIPIQDYRIGGYEFANGAAYYGSVRDVSTGQTCTVTNPGTWKCAVVGKTTTPPPSTANCNPGWTPGGPWTRQISDNDLDFSEGQGFEKLGLYPQYWWADGSNGSGGNSIYTYSGNVPDENYGKWSTYVPEGTYDAYAYIPTAAGNGDNVGGSSAFAGQVKYKVQSFSGQVYNVALIDQSANRGCWVKLGTGYGFTQGLRVAIQLGDQVDSASARRIYYDDVAFYQTAAPKPNWTVTPTTMTFNGVVDGAIADQTATITNTGGGSGTFASYGTNDAVFGARGFAVSLAAGASTTATFVATKCTAVGTTTGQISFIGSGSTATVALTRVCSAAPTTAWQASLTTLSFSDAVGGGAPAARTFNLSNSGVGGTYSISSNQTWLTASPVSSALNSGQSASINVAVADCSSAITENGILTISGGGSSATVNVSRVCQVALPAAPSLSLAMSSNGRMFLSWPEATGANSYSFQATFNGQAITVSGNVPASSADRGAAVATFAATPDAPDKAGKQVCFQIQAVNTTGSSSLSSAVCTAYRYYTSTSLQAASVGVVPQLKLIVP